MHKRRAFYAPFLIGLSGPFVRLLDIGVRVLPQREWVERERRMYASLYGSMVSVDPDGTLVLPYLAGDTLASLLENTGVADSVRDAAIGLAVVALVELHRAGFTHGDAMAENVMVDLDAGIARWFDFENTHDEHRPLAWRRADDLRALLGTCLMRTAPGTQAETLDRILDAYADEEIADALASSFASVLQRSLSFHLGQAGLSFQRFREIASLLSRRNARARRLLHLLVKSQADTDH